MDSKWSPRKTWSKAGHLVLMELDDFTLEAEQEEHRQLLNEPTGQYLSPGVTLDRFGLRPGLHGRK